VHDRDPVDILQCGEMADVNSAQFVPYEGPLPDSEEYKAEVAKFATI
jgi:hypothetical protein